MKRLVLCAAFALTVFAPAANAASCGEEMDALMKAISGHLTMSPEKKAALLRMTSSGYDHCMAGDTKHSGDIRDMVMTQIKEHLGGR